MSLLIELACTSVSVSTAPSPAPAEDEEEIPEGGEDLDPTDVIFDTSLVHTIAIEMAPAEWADVRDNPWAENWYAATFRWRDEVIENVGIRAFGAGSQIAGKSAIKLSFDRNVEGQTFRGLEQLKLDNSSQDYGYMNERIGTAVVRRMGLPAARSGWATVTVNGEPAGFFVLLEPIDDRFLVRWFGNDDGPLYGTWDWRYGQGLNPITWGGPLDWYVPQTSVTSDGTDIQEIVDIVAAGSDELLASRLDLDGFTGISVARTVMGAIDQFAADGNNFYLYNDNGYWRMIPWDLDADLGYPYYFWNALHMDVWAPWEMSHARYNPVTGALYSDPVLLRHIAMGEDLDARVRDVLATGMVWEEVDAEVAEQAALIESAVMDDLLQNDANFWPRIIDLRLFMHARLSLLAGAEVADCPDDEGVPIAQMGPTGSVGYGSIQLDATDWGPGFNVGGEHACTGMLAWAPSDVTITVPEGHTRLTGAVGLQDWTVRCADSVVFRIVQEGEVVWESGPVRNDDAALHMADVVVRAGGVRLIAEATPNNGCASAVWVGIRARR